MRTSWPAVLRPNHLVVPRTVWLMGLVQGALALLVWVSAGASRSVVPGPLEVAEAFKDLWLEQGLGPALGVSVSVNLEALAMASVISAGLAYAWVIPVMRPTVGLISKGRFLGLAGLTFVFTVALGGGHLLRLALLVLGLTVFLTTSMVGEVSAIASSRFEHARTLRMSEWRVVYEVVVLGTAERGLELIRQNAAIGWTMLTMVEGFTRAEGGVGAMLLDQNRHLHLAHVFALQATILAVGLVQDAALAALRRALCPYAER